MTRINSNIPPEELCDKHLLAEYREMPRIRSLLIKRCRKYSYHTNSVLEKVPDQYTLGAGHMMFFIDKGAFLQKRYNKIVRELHHRNFNAHLEWRHDVWEKNPQYNNDWKPREQNQELIRKRLIEKLPLYARFTQRLVPYWYGVNYQVNTSFSVAMNATPNEVGTVQ